MSVAKINQIIFIFVLVTVIVSLLFISCNGTEEEYPTVDQLSRKTQIAFPNDTKILFYKRILSLQSEVIYIKVFKSV